MTVARDGGCRERSSRHRSAVGRHNGDRRGAVSTRASDASSGLESEPRFGRSSTAPGLSDSLDEAQPSDWHGTSQRGAESDAANQVKPSVVSSARARVGTRAARAPGPSHAWTVASPAAIIGAARARPLRAGPAPRRRPSLRERQAGRELLVEAHSCQGLSTVSEGTAVTLTPLIQASAVINAGNPAARSSTCPAASSASRPSRRSIRSLGGAQASAVGFAIPSGTVTAVAAVSSRPADASARRTTDAAMRGSSCASRDRDARGT
jgi:hypothetical protein